MTLGIIEVVMTNVIYIKSLCKYNNSNNMFTIIKKRIRLVISLTLYAPYIIPQYV